MPLYITARVLKKQISVVDGYVGYDIYKQWDRIQPLKGVK